MNPLKGTSPERSPTSESDEEYEVEKIVAERINRKTGQMEYYTKWVGYDHNENTWEHSGAFEKNGRVVLAAWLNREKTDRKVQRTLSGSSDRGRMESENVEDAGVQNKGSVELQCQMNKITKQVFIKLDSTETRLQKTVEQKGKLEKEKEKLKLDNQALLNQAKNLDLFMLHQKDPERILRNRVEKLERDREVATEKFNMLQKSVREKSKMLQEIQYNTKINNSAQKRLDELEELVAGLLGVILDEPVVKSQVRDKIDLAKKVVQDLKETIGISD